jgi:hypothetical protein
MYNRHKYSNRAGLLKFYKEETYISIEFIPLGDSAIRVSFGNEINQSIHRSVVGRLLRDNFIEEIKQRKN